MRSRVRGAREWTISIGVVALMLVLLASRASAGIERYLVPAFIVFIAVFCAATVVRSLRARRQAGAVLVDCGPVRERASSVGLGALVLGVTTVLIARGTSWAVPVAMLPASVVLIVRGLGRVQLREQGVWSGFELASWEEIESADWDPKMPSAIDVERRGAVAKSIRFSVRPELRQAVHEVLRDRLNRCPRCGYDFAGHEGTGPTRCPECGMLSEETEVTSG